MNITSKQKNYFVAAALGAAVLAGLLGHQVGVSSGLSEGHVAGFAEGSRDGWKRAVVATTDVAYWQGAIDGCNTVFDAVGWEYIYVNVYAGGGTISRSYFCKDSGDHSSTPVIEIPYVESVEGSN